MKKRLFLGFFGCLSITAQAQTSIFGEITLFDEAQLTFFDAPVYFNEGNITGQEMSNSFVTFFGAQQEFASNDSYVEVPILSRRHAAFTFPTGDRGSYQPLSVFGGDDSDLMVFFQQLPYADLSLTQGIDFISSQFHWLVSGEKRAQLELSWNPSSRLSQITNNLEELTILGYTSSGWEVIPSQLMPFSIDGLTPTSLAEGRLLSKEEIALSRFEALTIGGVKRTNALLVSEALTPNGDNVNDTWYIKNIDRYPNAVIRVFNRWGGEVFFHRGIYRNDWNGTYKNKRQILPAAPYYYRIDLEDNGSIDYQGWMYINY